jgi:MFS family permease
MSESRSLRPSILYHPNYALLLSARLLSTMAMLIQSVTLGWQVYDIARIDHSVEQSSFLVGMIGLVQFVPMLAMTLPAGESVDRYDRRKILQLCLALQIVCSVALAWLALDTHPSLVSIFGIAAFLGISRAFAMPATSAMAPMLVPREVLPRAIAWSTLAMQFGMVIGPWIGGILAARSVGGAYATSAAFFVLAELALAFIRAETRPEYNGNASRLTMIREGLTYVWTNKVVFGAISLDLFAVLLGGVTSLLPVFARDVLNIGAEGFGVLRSATAIGGGAMALYLSFRPLQRRAGMWLLGAVAVFGAATIIFALSPWLSLSLIALAVAGAADSISMFVRHSIVQLLTPDAMRGRVAAVSSVFISASNELGEFESGVAARLIGPIGAAIFGGVGSIAVTGLWARHFPALRRTDRLGE